MDAVEELVAGEVAKPVEEAAGVDSGPPGGFKKGDDPRRYDLPNTKKGKAKPKRVEQSVPEDGAPADLQDMRWVYLNHKQYDKTNGHALMRSFLEKSPKDFLAAKGAAEAAHAARVTVGGDVDAGSGRALGLCEEWLKELSKGADRDGRDFL